MPTTTKSRPRTKPPETRRDELMNAAERLFLSEGVAPTTIEHITSGAGVAKGTFYLYFSSKDDVLAALADRFAQKLLERIKTAVAEKAAEDWKGKLEAWATACVTGYLDSIRLHDILFYGSRPHTREGMVDNIVVDHLADLLHAGLDCGAWSIDDPRLAAVFVFNGLHGVVDDAYSAAHSIGKRVNRTRLTERVQRLCSRAVS
jgi:AcrR family transcriptional regulator